MLSCALFLLHSSPAVEAADLSIDESIDRVETRNAGSLQLPAGMRVLQRDAPVVQRLYSDYILSSQVALTIGSEETDSLKGTTRVFVVWAADLEGHPLRVDRRMLFRVIRKWTAFNFPYDASSIFIVNSIAPLPPLTYSSREGRREYNSKPTTGYQYMDFPFGDRYIMILQEYPFEESEHWSIESLLSLLQSWELEPPADTLRNAIYRTDIVNVPLMPWIFSILFDLFFLGMALGYVSFRYGALANFYSFMKIFLFLEAPLLFWPLVFLFFLLLSVFMSNQAQSMAASLFIFVLPLLSAPAKVNAVLFGAFWMLPLILRLMLPRRPIRQEIWRILFFLSCAISAVLFYIGVLFVFGNDLFADPVSLPNFWNRLKGKFFASPHDSYFNTALLLTFSLLYRRTFAKVFRDDATTFEKRA
jgi:hypothetical protein